MSLTIYGERIHVAINLIRQFRPESLFDAQETLLSVKLLKYEPVHEISDNVVCATSKASDQPAHTRSLTRAFASRLSIL